MYADALHIRDVCASFTERSHMQAHTCRALSALKQLGPLLAVFVEHVTSRHADLVRLHTVQRSK
jgi:hypothetical protein